jgi:hypothetical protein
MACTVKVDVEVNYVEHILNVKQAIGGVPWNDF